MLKNKTTDAFIQVSLDSLNTRERQAPYNSGIVYGGHDLPRGPVLARSLWLEVCEATGEPVPPFGGGPGLEGA